MAPNQHDKQRKRFLEVRRYPNDFTALKTTLPQFGACCCCCCCCVHWIGAVAGGIYGVRVASKRDKSQEPPVHPFARRQIFRAMLFGALVSVSVLGVAGIWAANIDPPKPSFRRFLQNSIGFVFAALVYVPSLAFLLVGGAALIGAHVAKRQVAHQADPVEREEMAAGVRLALKIIGWSLLLSTVFGLIGYLGTIWIVWGIWLFRG